MPLTFGSLFAGIGGMDLGLERVGFECKWQVEIDPYARRVLAKHWPDVPRHDDVRTFPPADGNWSVDLIAGGFPCQDISFAGRGAGLAGKRSGLWYEFARIVCDLRPRFVLVENVAALRVRGLDAVLGTLASLGYDAEWSSLSACAMGAPHARDRMFVVADRDQVGRRGPRFGVQREHGVSPRFGHWQTPSFDLGWEDVERWFKSFVSTGDGATDATRSAGMGDGVSGRLDRTGAIGNAVVPQVAEWIGRRIIESVA